MFHCLLANASHCVGASRRNIWFLPRRHLSLLPGERKRKEAATNRHKKSIGIAEITNPESTNAELSPSATKSPSTRLTYASIEAITGFFEPRLLDVYRLLDEVQKDRNIFGHVLEIGVYHGRSFLPLCNIRRRDKGGKFVEAAVAIDCFQNQEHNVDHSGVGDLRAFQENLARNGFGTVEHLFHKGKDGSWVNGKSGNFEPSGIAVVHADSLSLAPSDILAMSSSISSLSERASLQHTQTEKSVRFFSVDGSHTEESVVSDLSLANDCLVDGGIVLLDDALNQDWPGVSSGLGTFLHSINAEEDNRGSLFPFALGYNKCLLTNQRTASNSFQDALKPLERKRACFHGAEVSILPQGFIAVHYGND